jgi:Tfp pilus assembly protein PilZ
MTTPVPERRRAERITMPPVGGPVSVAGARLLDVSPYGMQVETPIAMAVDSRMEFRLTVSGAKHDVEARVASCRPVTGGRRAYGVGLEFTRVPDGLREQLRELLAAWQKEHPPGA